MPRHRGRSEESSSSSSSSTRTKTLKRHDEESRNKKKNKKPQSHVVSKARTHVDQIGFLLEQILLTPRFKSVWFNIATVEGFFNGTLKEVLPVSSRHKRVLRIETTNREVVYINLEKMISITIVDKDVTFTGDKEGFVLNRLPDPRHISKSRDGFEATIREILHKYEDTKTKVKLHLVPLSSSSLHGTIDFTSYGAVGINKNSIVATSHISAVEI